MRNKKSNQIRGDIKKRKIEKEINYGEVRIEFRINRRKFSIIFIIFKKNYNRKRQNRATTHFKTKLYKGEFYNSNSKNPEDNIKIFL